MADMEDWSLQAIVRGTSGDFSKSVDLDMDFEKNNSVFDAKSATQYDHLQFDREFLASFPEIFEALSGSGDELEELYKPFYPVAAHSDHLPPQTTSNVLDFQLEPNINGAEDRKPDLNDRADQSSPHTVTTGYTPKYKRRKNQHKRVVIQVTAEGLSSDMWAWRKYGQKPIKGSPYPRSYYRCSSSKGCLARKQVEQSCSDPGMFIITYTAEHSHSQPTRRNSLAGTVRQKFPTLKSSNSTTTTHVKQEKTEESAVISSVELVVNFNHQAAIIKEEINKEENAAAGGNDNDDVNMSEFVFSEDFFSGLEEFDEFIGDVSICQYVSAQQLHVRSC